MMIGLLAPRKEHRVYASAILLIMCAFCLGISAAGAADREVDVELVLAVDVSGSMDNDEHELQRQGYAAAFRHPGLIQVIQSGVLGRIAVTYYEWAGDGAQAVIVPWTEVHDTTSAHAFAEALSSKPRAWMRGTSISSGLMYGVTLFGANGFAAKRRVIDISGDGANSQGIPVEKARDFVVSQGVTINGLPVMLKQSWDPVPLDAYYKDCVVGGPGAFVIAVQDPAQWAGAIRRKLVLEIAAAPPRFITVSGSGGFQKVDCLIGEKRRRLQMWESE